MTPLLNTNVEYLPFCKRLSLRESPGRPALQLRKVIPVIAQVERLEGYTPEKLTMHFGSEYYGILIGHRSHKIHMVTGFQSIHTPIPSLIDSGVYILLTKSV